MKQKQKLLLLEDVEDLGRSGQVVSVRAGYARNFLFPERLAIFADKNTIRMQEKLQKVRAVKAAEDRKESEELVKLIEKISLSITVKVDVEGKMYGSVGAQEIVDLIEKHNIILTKKNIAIKKPYKDVGTFEVPIKLKEGVETKVALSIVAEKVKEEKEKKPRKKKAENKEGTETQEEIN